MSEEIDIVINPGIFVLKFYSVSEVNDDIIVDNFISSDLLFVFISY